MRAWEVAFVGTLVRRFPELLPLLEEHLEDYDGLLPHVFMGDVTRWIVKEFDAGSGSPILREMLDFVEATFGSGHEHEQELIAVSFVENLPKSTEPSGRIRDLLGPRLQKQMARME